MQVLLNNYQSILSVLVFLYAVLIHYLSRDFVSKKDYDKYRDEMERFKERVITCNQLDDKVVDRLDRMEARFEKSIDSIIISIDSLKKTMNEFMNSEIHTLKNVVVKAKYDVI